MPWLPDPSAPYFIDATNLSALISGYSEISSISGTVKPNSDYGVGALVGSSSSMSGLIFIFPSLVFKQMHRIIIIKIVPAANIIKFEL